MDQTQEQAPSNHGSRAALTVAALGVVFGDIGTSPLYSLQTVFSLDHGIVKPTPGDVYGVISMVFWSVTLIVSIKYLMFILKADNEGEGGIMSLSFLTRQVVRPGGRRFMLAMILGVFGGSLFFGDSLITPAISVLSAVEGLKVAAPSLGHVVLPISATIIALLFAVQRFGTHHVGRLFGPVMAIWFVAIGALGVWHIAQGPGIISALSPHHAFGFVLAHPFISFVAMGAVVLSITGAEALYADMGHFGRGPITRAWFVLVFPCLTLNYLGQGQLILNNPATASSPFFHLAPAWMQVPLVVLATMATIIASQAVISGAFSVARQAERLGFLPKLTVMQTSEHSGGQIYVPSVNWMLFIGVMALMLSFRASERLATAYGVAVTMDLMLTTTLFSLYAYAGLKWPFWKVAIFGTVFGTVEFVFWAGNITKVVHGGWLPLLVAFTLATVMLTWARGRRLVSDRRRKLEGNLAEFLDDIHGRHDIRRVPGVAVFLHPDPETTPLALRENVAFNKVMHDDVLIVSALGTNVPHVPPEQRVQIDDLGDPYDHITHVTLRFGFSDEQNVPAALALAVEHGLQADLTNATYFLSRITVHQSSRPGMSRWRKRLFIALAHNAANPAEYFHLPMGRTVIMGAQVMF